MKTLAIAFALLAGVAAAAHAQQLRVSLDATTNDQVGSQLAYAVREGIRRSAGLALVDDPESAAVRLQLVTLDPDTANGQIWTVYSVVYTIINLNAPSTSIFIRNFVGTCGLQRVSACAAVIVSRADEVGTELRKALFKK